MSEEKDLFSARPTSEQYIVENYMLICICTSHPRTFEEKSSIEKEMGIKPFQTDKTSNANSPHKLRVCCCCIELVWWLSNNYQQKNSKRYIAKYFFNFVNFNILTRSFWLIIQYTKPICDALKKTQRRIVRITHWKAQK